VGTGSKPNILSNVRCEGSRHFRNKGSHMCKLKLRNLKLTVRSKNISSLYGGIVTLRRATSLELMK